MSSPRLLVVEGNTAEGRKWHAEAGGIVASENYANVLRKLCPGARVDICFPADIGANLPDRGGLAVDELDGGRPHPLEKAVRPAPEPRRDIDRHHRQDAGRQVQRQSTGEIRPEDQSSG